MALGSLPCMQTLDVLAEWLSWRGITFSRMDGSTNPIQRELDVRDFNADGSPTKVFLISTRAGGVGINLASADVVILFDSDWNPQVDLQVRVESPPISLSDSLRLGLESSGRSAGESRISPDLPQ